MRHEENEAKLLAVPCPKCGAVPGRPCRRLDGTARAALHIDRFAVALAAEQERKASA